MTDVNRDSIFNQDKIKIYCMEKLNLPYVLVLTHVLIRMSEFPTVVMDLLSFWQFSWKFSSINVVWYCPTGNGHSDSPSANFPDE